MSKLSMAMRFIEQHTTATNAEIAEAINQTEHTAKCTLSKLKNQKKWISQSITEDGKRYLAPTEKWVSEAMEEKSWSKFKN